MPCEYLQQELQELQAEVTAAQNQLEAASPSEKAAILAGIRRLNQAIDQKQSELDACQDYAAHGPYHLRLHVIPFTDEQKDANGNPTRPYSVTPQEFFDLVDRVNVSFNGTNIRFVFDARYDWDPMADTLMNGTQNPIGTSLDRGNAIADQHKGKIVCFLRWGPFPNPTGNGNAFPPPGFWPKPSYIPDVDQRFVMLPNRIDPNYGLLNQNNGSMVAHELGHYLGLYHTFPGWDDRTGPIYAQLTGNPPSAAAADQAVIDFIDANGGTIQEALDGDCVLDTPPDPGRVLYDAHGQDICQQRQITIQGILKGKKVSFTLAPDPENIMSYFPGCAPAGTPPSPRHFSQQQIAQMIKTLQGPRSALIDYTWRTLSPPPRPSPPPTPPPPPPPPVIPPPLVSVCTRLRNQFRASKNRVRQLEGELVHAKSPAEKDAIEGEINAQLDIQDELIQQYDEAGCEGQLYTWRTPSPPPTSDPSPGDVGAPPSFGPIHVTPPWWHFTSISHELRVRMDAVSDQVDWSAVASRAFQEKLLEIELRSKRTMTKEDVVKRLKAAQVKEIEQDHAKGKKAGRIWAEKYATARQLRRLVKYLQEDNSFPRGYESLKIADAINRRSKARDYSQRDADDFWSSTLGSEVELIEAPDFREGFVDGAIEVWDEVKDELS